LGQSWVAPRHFKNISAGRRDNAAPARIKTQLTIILYIFREIGNEPGRQRYAHAERRGVVGTGRLEPGVGTMSCVLVVEDEALIAVETAEVLERHGFAVEIARSGELAVAKLRDGLQADILFTDINLAGAMDGATLARLARDLHPDLIVIYTSGTVLGVVQPVPGSAFVPKPYSPDAVCALLVRMAAVAA